MYRSKLDDKDIQRVLNALLYFGTHPTENPSTVAGKFNVPYRSTFRTILYKQIGWLEVNPADISSMQFCGPKPATREDAIHYLTICAKYSRDGSARRKKEKEEAIRKAIAEAQKQPTPGEGKMTTRELFDTITGGTTGQTALPFYKKDDRLKALALMEKAIKYKATDPVAFVNECLEDPRI